MHRRRRAGRRLHGRGRHPVPGQHRPVQIDEVQHDARDRIAGAPISWGVCEVPNWGYQLTPERVSPRCRTRPVGHRARPGRFLPADPAQMATVLARPPVDRRRRLHPGAPAPGGRPAPGDRPHPRRLRRHRRRGWSCRRSSGSTGTTAVRSSTTVGGAARNLDRIAGRAAEHGSVPCSTRTSAPWSRPGPRCQRVLEGSAIRCASTPGTCSSVEPTRPSSPGSCRSASPTPISRTSTAASRPRSGPVS